MANVTSDSSIEELVLIPGGEFLMGSDSERFGDHSPIIERPFSMLSARQIALWADRLRDISALGLHFTDSRYDRERYQAVQNVAMVMLVAATGEPVEELELLRATIFSHPTPLSVGDAAVIDDEGRILLVRRADNQKWAMPGGALEVGETPAEGVVREALEETGVEEDALPRDIDPGHVSRIPEAFRVWRGEMSAFFDK